MRNYISIKNVYSDEHLIEVAITVSKGGSSFICKAYTTQDILEETVKDLKSFADKIYGGIYDLRFGKFGREFAGGAFLGRFHFYKQGSLYISTHQESEYEAFKDQEVAEEASFYMKSGPFLIENYLEKFTDDLSLLHTECGNEAVLECNSP